MSACWIALGGNEGSVAETFRQALALLGQTPGLSVVRRSRDYTTAPVGTHSGQQFLNAAAELETAHGPCELLGILQSVETRLGRVRTRRWGPRTLDLDLLFYDQQVLSSDTLTIPHPHLWYRRFVLDPLVEIAPDLLHPQHQMSISQLREQLLIRPLPCLIIGGEAEERHALQLELATNFPQTVWDTTPPQSIGLAFSLERGKAESLVFDERRDARTLRLSEFPTPPLETICDVLHAALDAPRAVA